MFTVSVNAQVDVSSDQLADETNPADLIRFIRDICWAKCDSDFDKQVILTICAGMSDPHTDHTLFIEEVVKTLKGEE
jgi:hypothetical protein